jgi:hypothetical protein
MEDLFFPGIASNMASIVTERDKEGNLNRKYMDFLFKFPSSRSVIIEPNFSFAATSLLRVCKDFLFLEERLASLATPTVLFNRNGTSCLGFALQATWKFSQKGIESVWGISLS